MLAIAHRRGDLHRGVFEGVALSDATISAKAHLSGERRTASITGKQESSSRGKVDGVSCGVTLSELCSFEWMA